MSNGKFFQASLLMWIRKRKWILWPKCYSKPTLKKAMI